MRVRKRKTWHRRTGLRARFPKEYNSWMAARRRCYYAKDVSFKYVGGRGLGMCDRWRYSFQSFIEDMGPKPSASHSIDRIDNDRGYDPGNCRWATGLEQMANTRTTRLLTFKGETLCLSAWARKTGIPMGTIISRIKRFGWTPEQALTVEPMMGNHPFADLNRPVPPTSIKTIWHKPRQKWQAIIRFQGNPIYCGHFSTKEEAAKAATLKANELGLGLDGAAPSPPACHAGDLADSLKAPKVIPEFPISKKEFR